MRVPLMAPQAHTHNACRPWHRTSAASVVLAIGLLVSAITPASAIVDGQLDTGNEYPNVGTIQIFADGQWWLLGCTATLVAPDAVLTAAHCTADVFFGFVAPSDIRITFEAEPGENSVGYKVDIKHTAPTTIGQKVTIKAKAIESTERKAVFEVEAYNDTGAKIGEGTHERRAIDMSRFSGGS